MFAISGPHVRMFRKQRQECQRTRPPTHTHTKLNLFFSPGRCPEPGGHPFYHRNKFNGPYSAGSHVIYRCNQAVTCKENDNCTRKAEMCTGLTKLHIRFWSGVDFFRRAIQSDNWTTSTAGKENQMHWLNMYSPHLFQELAKMHGLPNPTLSTAKMNPQMVDHKWPAIATRE